MPGMLLRFLTLLLLPGYLYAASWPTVVDERVAQAKRAVQTIDLHAFKKLVDDPGDALIIDVRESSEYERGYIHGAINIPRGLLEFRIWKVLGFPGEVDLARPIYLYCKLSGRSALAAESLTHLGFTNVVAVDMQLAQWEKAGYTLDF